MEQILHTFGIDWRLLLINGVNFGLLLLALWYFLYGPVMKMLEERRERVAQGVRDAEAAARERSDIEHSRAAVLAEAGKEAEELVAAAREDAGVRGREMLSRAEAAAASLVKDAEAQAAELKHQALEESKKDIAKLIVLGMEKIK